MEHLNYCRQIKMAYASGNLLLDGDDRELARLAENYLDPSIKFILPNSGRVIVDGMLKALDGEEKLRLPYPLIALEYPMIEGTSGTVVVGHSAATKRVLIASELNDEFIGVSIYGFLRDRRTWCFGGAFAVARDNWMLRDEKGKPHKLAVKTKPGFPIDSFNDDIIVLFMFLNALNCSNVHIEKSQETVKGKKLKSPVPFDSYHFLMVDVPKKPGLVTGHHITGRASPREHLRRGHIRKLEDGRKFWVNATVVAAGNGGKIHKDYGIRRAA